MSPMKRVIAKAAAQEREGVGDGRRARQWAEGQAEDLIMVPLSGGPLLGVERV